MTLNNFFLRKNQKTIDSIEGIKEKMGNTQKEKGSQGSHQVNDWCAG